MARRAPGGEKRDYNGRDDNAGGDEHRCLFRSVRIRRVGGGNEGRNRGGVAYRGGGGQAGEARAAREPVGHKHHCAGNGNHRETETESQQAALPDILEVNARSNGERKKRNQHRHRAAEEFAQVAVQVAKQHADAKRQDGAHERGPGKSSQAG